MTRLLLTILTPMLAVACGKHGACPPTSPPLPPGLVETRGPCLTQPPPLPSPELIRLADKDSLTPEEEVWLWTWVEVVQSRMTRDWKLCGPQKEQP